MGCNCKKNAENLNPKYVEGITTEKKDNILNKVLFKILQVLLGLLCGTIILVCSIPMVVYVILCVIFGKQAKFNITFLRKYM